MCGRSTGIGHGLGGFRRSPAVARLEAANRQPTSSRPPRPASAPTRETLQPPTVIVAPANGGIRDRVKVRLPHTTAAIEMVRMPAGKVQLGARAPGQEPRTVEVKSIWISTTEITWDMAYYWLGVCGDGPAFKPRRPDVRADAITGPSGPPYGGYGQPEGNSADGAFPALNVGYVGATHYCNWLFDQSDRRFRLPTEAEWEFACRAGGPPLENLTDAQLDPVAWYLTNTVSDDYPNGVPHRVATKAPNAWGLYDMLGNAAEWVQQEPGEAMPYVKGWIVEGPGGGGGFEPAVLRDRPLELARAHRTAPAITHERCALGGISGCVRG
jgi:hypothetical protein